MSQKISKLDGQNYNCLDFKILESSLKQGGIDDMTDLDLEKEQFKEEGIIPNKVAKADAEVFGLRKAYFDIFKPVNPSTPGVWKLEKDASGSEYIVRSDGE